MTICSKMLRPTQATRALTSTEILVSGDKSKNKFQHKRKKPPPPHRKKYSQKGVKMAFHMEKTAPVKRKITVHEFFQG